MDLLRPDIIAAQERFDALEHHNIHIKELLEQHSDLQTVLDDKNNMDFYAASINPLVDKVEFTKGQENTTYVDFHKVLPFKNVQTNCSKCDGLIRVNSSPFGFPVLIAHELKFRDDYNWFPTNYEDILKIYNFSPKVLAEIQLYIIDLLDKEAKLNRKINKTFLPSSIKKLLPFT